MLLNIPLMLLIWGYLIYQQSDADSRDIKLFIDSV